LSKSRNLERPSTGSGRTGLTRTVSSPEPTLRGRALRLLGRREFSRQALEKRLRSYVDPEKPGELETLLDDLAERGWLSDARYAEAVVRKRTGQYARRSIAQELKQAGVSQEVTAAALVQNLESDPDEEFAAALALCQRKFRKAPIEQKEKARQMRFLQSRGYGFGLALRVIKQLALSQDGEQS
jgi:regulatory protein